MSDEITLESLADRIRSLEVALEILIWGQFTGDEGVRWPDDYEFNEFEKPEGFKPFTVWIDKKLSSEVRTIRHSIMTEVINLRKTVEELTEAGYATTSSNDNATVEMDASVDVDESVPG